MLMLIGGILGFLIGISFGLLQKSEWPSTILHACIATYLSAVLLRWWGKIWMTSLVQARYEQQNRPRVNPPVPAAVPSAVNRKKP